MNKKLAIILIIAAFLIGVIIGYQTVIQKYEKEFQINDENQMSGHVSLNVYLLNLLRTNDTNKAIGHLEDDLDWDLIFLNIVMSNAPASPLNPYFPKAIQKAKTYREKFPYKSGNHLEDEDVSNVFLRIDSSTNK